MEFRSFIRINPSITEPGLLKLRPADWCRNSTQRQAWTSLMKAHQPTLFWFIDDTWLPDEDTQAATTDIGKIKPLNHFCLNKKPEGGQEEQRICGKEDNKSSTSLNAARVIGAVHVSRWFMFFHEHDSNTCSCSEKAKFFCFAFGKQQQTMWLDDWRSTVYYGQWKCLSFVLYLKL